MKRMLKQVGFGMLIILCFISQVLPSSKAAELATEPQYTYPSHKPASDNGGTFSQEQPTGGWSFGTSMGFLGSTPDGAALAFNGNGEYFIEPNVSVGPLLQTAFTDDMAMVGLSGQAKVYLDIPNTQGRARMAMQAGVGFAGADFRSDDASWLVPLGIGYEYSVSPRVSLSATGLVNFTHLRTGAGSGADVMPGFSFGIRF